jgi:thiol-disulfide isomerase/thioredoxin
MASISAGEKKDLTVAPNRPTLVSLMSPGCPHCVTFNPTVQQLGQHLAADGVTVVGIDLSELSKGVPVSLYFDGSRSGPPLIIRGSRSIDEIKQVIKTGTDTPLAGGGSDWEGIAAEIPPSSPSASSTGSSGRPWESPTADSDEEEAEAEAEAGAEEVVVIGGETKTTARKRQNLKNAVGSIMVSIASLPDRDNFSPAVAKLHSMKWKHLPEALPTGDNDVEVLAMIEGKDGRMLVVSGSVMRHAENVFPTTTVVQSMADVVPIVEGLVGGSGDKEPTFQSASNLTNKVVEMLGYKTTRTVTGGGGGKDDKYRQWAPSLDAFMK